MLIALYAYSLTVWQDKNLRPLDMPLSQMTVSQYYQSFLIVMIVLVFGLILCLLMLGGGQLSYRLWKRFDVGFYGALLIVAVLLVGARWFNVVQPLFGITP